MPGYPFLLASLHRGVHHATTQSLRSSKHWLTLTTTFNKYLKNLLKRDFGWELKKT